MRNTPWEALDTLHDEADTIEELGGTVTQEFATIRDRWRAMRKYQPDYREQIAQALLGDTPPDQAHLASLQALALAHSSATPVQRAESTNATAAQLLPHQREEWEKTLNTNYATAASLFNQAATALTEALNTVDADARPETLMDASTKERTAWAEIPMLTARVNEAENFLRFAATKAKAPTDEATSLGLTAKIPTTADRRKTWDALDATQGRAGKWGTLHKLGATLTAPTTPDAITSYRRPKPLETRYLRGNTGMRAVEYDPETDTPAGALPASASM